MNRTFSPRRAVEGRERVWSLRQIVSAICVTAAQVVLAAPSWAAPTPCAIDGNCIEVALRGPAAPVAPGQVFAARLLFQQGSDDEMPGGVDQIAALSLTIDIPDLELADCSSPGSNGLNPSFVVLGNPSRYRVIVQNLRCTGEGTCLCPESGEADAHLNLLLVGTPNAQGVQPLPNGALLDIRLQARPGARSGIPLHIYSPLDTLNPFPLPDGIALLSVGDRLAVDRTIDPDTQRLNVRIEDGEVAVANPTATATATVGVTAAVTATPTAQSQATATAVATETAAATATSTAGAGACTGDCNDSGEVTINELLVGVRIALGSDPLSTCAAFDCRGNGEIAVSCLIAAVNASLNGCPMNGN